MKLKNYLFIFVATLALVSCKSDDDNNQDTTFLLNSTNLAGTYELTFLESIEEETFLVNNVPVESRITTVGDTFQVDFVVNANGTFSTSGEYRSTETTVVGQADPVIDTEIILLNETGTYVLNANNETLSLTSTGDNESIQYSITTFNENEVRLLYEFSEIVNDLPYSTSTEIHLRRQ